jgi:hypothetical protein
VNSRVGLAIALGLAGTASLGLAAYSHFRRRWRRKSPEEIERLRRLELNQRGRITFGTVLEWLEPPAEAPATRIIVYMYEVAGVTYEVGQDCTALAEVVRSATWLPGQTVSIKYDLKSPSNSIVACEEWNGFPKDPIAPASDLPFSPVLDSPAEES